MKIDGTESLAATLEWIAAQIRAGAVTGVSLELTSGVGRLAVSFAVPDENAPARAVTISVDPDEAVGIVEDLSNSPEIE